MDERNRNRNRQAHTRVSRRTLVKGTGAAAATGAMARFGAVPIRAQEEVELRWSMWSASEAETAVWQGLADDVKVAHPNITVTLETTTFADYWDKLTTQLASDTQADVIAMQSLRMPGFAARNALAPLQPLIDADAEVAYDDFFTSIQEGLSFRDEIYAFGYDLGPIILYYNKDLFDAAGVAHPSPTEPLTWDQFVEAATAITNGGEGQYGFTMQPNFTGFIPWLWSGGGDYMNAEETECTLNAPEAVEALSFLTGLFTEQLIATPITDLSNNNFASEQFTSGKVGMTTNGPWNFVNLRNDATFAWDIAPLPGGPAGSVTWVAGSGFGLSRVTEHPDEAWQALKVITSSESLQKLAAAGRGYPARQSAVPAFVDPEAPPEQVAIVEQVLTAEGMTRFLRTTTTWQETEIMLTREFNPVFLGDQSVDDTIATVKEEFDDLLERHQEIIERGGE